MDNQSYVIDERLDIGFKDSYEAMLFYKKRAEDFERAQPVLEQDKRFLADWFNRAEHFEDARELLTEAFSNLSILINQSGDEIPLHGPAKTIGEANSVLLVIAIARMLGMAPFRVTQTAYGFFGVFGSKKQPPATERYGEFVIPFVPEVDGFGGAIEFSADQVRELAAEAAAMERARCVGWCNADDKYGVALAGIATGKPSPT